jgi:hypothetical protein
LPKMPIFKHFLRKMPIFTKMPIFAKKHIFCKTLILSIFREKRQFLQKCLFL